MIDVNSINNRNKDFPLISTTITYCISSFTRRDYGFLGITLQQAVFKARNAPPPPPTTTSERGYTTSIPQNTTTTTIINQITTTPPSVSQVRQQITPRITYVYTAHSA